MTIADWLRTGAYRRLARGVVRGGISGLVALLLLPAGINPGLANSGKRDSRQVQQAIKKAHPKKPLAKKAAAGKPTRKKRASPPLRAAILIDTDTGAVLSATKPDMPAFPASLTKMMTLYLTFAALNEGSLGLDQRLPVSEHAARQAPTKLWLKPGDTVRVRQLILALVTRSANDAAVVLAETMADDEAAFAERMTATARRLGMSHTTFRNASGLPDPAQRTTARDIARLALALYQDFPREYDYFSVRKFEFRGATISGHNRLLQSYDGSDGIKTGFTRAAGFNLAASAERDGRRLIGVILGSPSWRIRDGRMTALLDRGFAALGATRTTAADTVEPAPRVRKPAGAIARLPVHASPVGKAEAAPRTAAKVAPQQMCTIQIGVFRARPAAVKLARSVSRLSAAKHRDIRIRRVGKGGKGRLYAVQVSDFTEKAARNACAGLTKRKMSCIVLRAPEEG